MAKRKKANQLREERCIREMRKIMTERTPKAIEKLYDLLENEEMTPSTTLSVIKEILERSLGKGQLVLEKSEDDTEKVSDKFELVLKVME